MASSTLSPAGFVPTPFNRMDDFTNIKSIPGDNLFKLGKKKIANYTHEYWFLYFWKEAQGAWGQKGTAKGADKIIEFFNIGFEKTADWPVKERGRPMASVDGQNPPLKPKGNFESLFTSIDFCNYLDVMLNIGFDWYSATGSSERGTEHLRYIRLIDKTVGFEIRWRGESSRAMTTVMQQGYNKQALIPKLRSDFNLGESWHPFSKPDNSSKFWYRKTNGDNDWYTVVSVALDWRVSLGFPKIEQTSSMRILTANQVIDQKFAIRYPEQIGQVEFEDGAKEWRMLSRSKIALLLMDTMYFDTQARQREGKSLGDLEKLKQADPSFPEQGTGLIAGKNVMGMVEFIRVHHGHDDAAGFSAVLDRGRTRQIFKNDRGVQSELLAALGTEEAATRFTARLQEAWADATRQNIVHLRWTANGYQELHGAAQTRGIRTITLARDRIY